MKRVDCPDDIARRILDMRRERALPVLKAIAQYPTMTPSGRVLEKLGYDQETGILLLNPSGEPWPGIPLQPTIDEVLAALEKLWSPFVRFPFADETSRSVALAALLTATVRRTLPTAPAFMFAAPCAGSGKTLLASCVLELAGRVPTSTLSVKEEEVQKTLIAELRKAPPAIFFDNTVGTVNSMALNAMLTADVYEGRILGQSETSGALPTNVLVVLTGNNARPAGDTCRRMLVSTIDPRTEQPYRRQFPFNPLDMVRADRMGMVAAALSILRGWMTSGVGQLAPSGLGSIEAWDRLGRQAVVWAGRL